jgi:multiple sugar transport system permease protein
MRTVRHPRWRYQISLWFMLLPFILGTCVLVIVPMAYSFSLAFLRYDGLSAPIWVGAANFRQLSNDPIFWQASRNSLLFLACTIPMRLILTLVLALLLNRPRHGMLLYRTALYLPTIVPGVAYALMWLWVLNPLYGPLNLILSTLGIPPIAWLADSRTALLAIAVTALFQIGEGFVMVLAGLREIPADYYAAAAIDGAGAWATVRHLTLPLLAPWLLLVVIRDIITLAQNSFTPVLIMTGGGPYYATLLLPLLIYQTAFDRLRFGEAAAITLVVLLGIALLIACSYWLLGGWGYDDEV